MEQYKDIYGNTVFLTFNPIEFVKPGHVLILPFYQSRLVFTQHRKRGIELPGGKIEANETPLAAAVRETYEEIGASLSKIKLIGQYLVKNPNETFVKSIYTAVIDELLPIKFQSDTLGPIQFNELPIHVKDRSEFSDYMKDEVYPRTLQFLNLI